MQGIYFSSAGTEGVVMENLVTSKLIKYFFPISSAIIVFALRLSKCTVPIDHHTTYGSPAYSNFSNFSLHQQIFLTLNSHPFIDQPAFHHRNGCSMQHHHPQIYHIPHRRIPIHRCLRHILARARYHVPYNIDSKKETVSTL